MRNLTQEQKAIISENLNFESLMQDLNNDKLEWDRIHHSNYEILDDFEEIVSNYIDDLRSIFNYANIYVWSEMVGHSYKIYFGTQSQYESNQFSQNAFHVTIVLDSMTAHFKSGIDSITEYFGTHRILFNHNGQEKTFVSLNNLLMNEQFKKLITDIFFQANI